jgi:hypothetical protein
MSSTETKLDLWVVQITPPADKADAQSKSPDKWYSAAFPGLLDS